MDVQIFGIRKSSETRAALRFFAERRIRTHFVDLTERAPGPREIGRFAQKFGVDAILDRDGRRFRDLGLANAHLSDARWLDRLVEDPLMLRMPLVRAGNRLSVGAAEDDWRQWIEESGG